MKRYLITFIMLLATAILHLAIRQAEAKTAASSPPPELMNLPSEILEFRQAGPDIPVPDSIKKQLESNAIVMRSYLSPNGRTILMTIVCAGATRRSLHFPEVCFTGQGWETQDKAPIPVGVYFVGQGLTLQRGKSRQAVLYWFKTGNDFTGSYFVNSLCWVRDKLLLRNPSSLLIRLSTPIGSSDEERAFRMLNDFASSLAPFLRDRVP